MALSKIMRRFWTAVSSTLSLTARKTTTKQQITNVYPEMSTSTAKSWQALEKLREFGYVFNAEGQLRKIDEATGEASEEPFEFDVFNGNQAKNQQHYEKLADQIPEIVYDLLEQQGLSKTFVPEELPPEQASFIFTQPAKLDKPKKLIVIIHGSGYVRAGQWARSLIINNSIDHGTQIPYIKRAKALGYDILITNTNDNYRSIDGVRKPIARLNSPVLHAVYVWEKYVMKSQPESVAIVAHSYGGAVTLELAKRFPQFFKDKVFAIALTDSAHFSVPNEVKQIVANITCNWVSSSESLDKEMQTPKGDIKRVSAGHPKHEWSSYAAFESVFKFLEHKYTVFTGGSECKRAKLDL